MTTPLIITRDHVIDGLLPIKHLSYSAIRCYLSSENLFFKKYVRLEFDEKGKPAMIVGNAAHEAFEKLYQDLLADHQHRLEGAELFEHYNEFAQGVFTRYLNEHREKAKQRLGITEIDPEKEAETLTAIEKEAIEWGKTITEKKCREQLASAIKNKLEHLDDTETISTEIMETVQFTDLEGNLMPLPLKGIIDRIERRTLAPGSTEEGLRDYKVVAKFSNPDERNPGYELQAAAFYFIFQGLRGYPPKYAIFEEVLKSEGGYICKDDPTRKLLQADLRELCDTHMITWEKYDKNVQLQEKLVMAGVLVKEPGVQKIEYIYEERMDIIDAFLEVYKVILNRLGMDALYDLPIKPLPNPFDQMSGKEAWSDFTEVLESGIDAKKRPTKKEAEIDPLDDFDF